MRENSPRADHKPNRKSLEIEKGTDEALACPACGSRDVREITSKLVFDRSGFDFEVYHLGGCTVPVERWVCAACGKEW